MTSLVHRSVLCLLIAAICGLSPAVLPAQAKPFKIKGITDAAKTGKPADDGEGVVVAEGIGLDADRALKYALFQAVRQVVGTYIDAETLVKNDKVLTHSRGLVTDYKVISKGKQDGLIRITIRATVQYKKLAAALKAVNLLTREFPGRSLYATALSRAKTEADATALFAKALCPGFLDDIVTAEVVGQPKLVDRKGGEATLHYDVRLGTHCRPGSAGQLNSSTRGYRAPRNSQSL